MPKISVIVPVYNVEKYLERCISSILEQSFKDFEVLLVNDASTDKSLEVARRFLPDHRVRVLDKPHGGLGDTRNFGAMRASGRYLLFVDSDDWIEKDMLLNLYTAAEEYHADLVVFNYIRENLRDKERRVCSLPLNYPEFGAEVHDILLEKLIGPDEGESAWRGVEMLGCAWRRMYLKSWYDECGISFGDEQRIMLEDLPASIRAHCCSKRLLVLGGAYYHYRFNPFSLSTRYRPNKMEMLTRCFLTVRRILTDAGLYERYEERHSAWFVRFAAHSSLVNCFSPMNQKGFMGRYREVGEILKNPELRKALRSGYLKRGTRADRIVYYFLWTGFTPLVYGFYKLYSRSLIRSTGKI